MLTEAALDYIGAAMENPRSPEAYRASFADEVKPDTETMEGIRDKMQPWTTDEEAVAGVNELFPLAQKWGLRASETASITDSCR